MLRPEPNKVLVTRIATAASRRMRENEQDDSKEWSGASL
jgi:hypothetical protein